MLRDLIMTTLLKSKINTDGCKITLLELIVSEPSQKRTLPHRTVTDYYDFKEIVVLPYHIPIILIIN